MKKFQEIFTLGGTGAVVGGLIAEFFPKLFSLGASDAIANWASSGPFSEFRNDLALRYGGIGLVAGAAIGLVLVLLKKK
jgi:hypothetical protein